jgi:homocysteine S-methyltransferase
MMMPLPTLPDFLQRHPYILGEGAVIERLRRQPATKLDPHLVNSAFIYDEVSRRPMEAIYREYLQIGRDHQLPMILTAPTWRASAQNIAAAGFGDRAVNADNLRLLQELRSQSGTYAKQVLIGGLIGCRGDAYRPDEALSTEKAHEFHTWQTEQLTQGGADFLLGITLPALTEAIGLAQAMAGTRCPYLISFVVRPTGTLLDGTKLTDAISTIDSKASPRPTGFLINCTHPDLARAALFHPVNCSATVRQRIIGLLANTAALSPEDLDGREELVEEEPARFAAAMMGLHRDSGLKILGGCCGTDDRHIRALAGLLSQSYRPNP